VSTGGGASRGDRGGGGFGKKSENENTRPRTEKGEKGITDF
jgi:hypothetical protein